MPDCDRQTHTQTHEDGIYRANIVLHSKKPSVKIQRSAYTHLIATVQFLQR